MIADSNTGNALANTFDDATALVPEDGRKQPLRVGSTKRVCIRVTQSTRMKLYAHLTSLGRVHLSSTRTRANISCR